MNRVAITLMIVITMLVASNAVAVSFEEEFANDLKVAIGKKDQKKVLELVKRADDLNYFFYKLLSPSRGPEYYEKSILIYSARMGWTDVVSYMIDEGVDLEYSIFDKIRNSKNGDVWELENQRLADCDIEEGGVALASAIAGGHYKIADMLVEAGSDLDYAVYRACRRWTKATKESDAEDTAFSYIIKLLELGADIEYVDCYGLTTLHRVVGGSNTRLVKFLLDNGASLKTKDHQGKTAYERARSVDMKKFLEEY